MKDKGPNIFSEEILVEMDRVVCSHSKDGYYNFFRLAWGVIERRELVDNWHIRYICGVLQREVERISRGEKKGKDIIICIPPRSSKSSMVAVFLNAWVWTIYPQLKFITCSYSSGLSEQHSIKTKLIIESDWYRNRWGDVFKISQKKNTNTFYQNSVGGERFATSVGGTVTGAGGDILIGDDLINVGDSKSKAKREKAVDFYKNTLYNRLDEPSVGLRIIINQRTHEEDVVGVMTKENEEDFDFYIFPSELRDGVKVLPLGIDRYYVDGLFDPNRFPKDTLLKYEGMMTDYPEQYLQDCKRPGGNLWKPRKWFFEFDINDLYERVRDDRGSLVWYFEFDGAYTKNHDNDPSVCICYTYYLGRWWIKGIFRRWLDYEDLISELRDWLWKMGYNSSSVVRVEPKANGKSVVDSLIRHGGMNVVESYSPDTDKVSMAYSVIPILMSERVGVMYDMEGKEDYYKELEMFPKSEHDDRVDVTVMMIKNGEEGSDILASG